MYSLPGCACTTWECAIQKKSSSAEFKSSGLKPKIKSYCWNAIRHWKSIYLCLIHGVVGFVLKFRLNYGHLWLTLRRVMKIGDPGKKIMQNPSMTVSLLSSSDSSLAQNQMNPKPQPQNNPTPQRRNRLGWIILLSQAQYWLMATGVLRPAYKLRATWRRIWQPRP